MKVKNRCNRRSIDLEKKIQRFIPPFRKHPLQIYTVCFSERWRVAKRLTVNLSLGSKTREGLRESVSNRVQSSRLSHDPVDTALDILAANLGPFRQHWPESASTRGTASIFWQFQLRFAPPRRIPSATLTTEVGHGVSHFRPHNRNLS